MESGYLFEHILGFVHLLREMGIAVGPGQALDLTQALEYAPVTSREDFRAAARCTLINRREDLPLFDAAFTFYWRTPGSDPMMLAIPQTPVPGKPLRLPRRPRPPGSGESQTPEQEEITLQLAYSANELLRKKDFGSFTWEEVQSAKTMMRAMQWRLEERRTRRRRPSRRGRQLDMRRLLRRNLRYGGEMLDLTWRAHRTKQRPLVVVCDISGSMERYSRILLQFIHAMTGGLHDVESFVFGTRLTRITRMLLRRDIDEAVGEVSKQVLDWSGGTRIGDAVRDFNYHWGRRVLGRGAVVLLISDGWDRGEPELLGREMDRLQRSCHRLIWLNPLLGSPGYQPLTRGIQAALPFVDDFLPVHNLISLEQLGERLSAIGERRPARRQRPVKVTLQELT